MSENKRLFTVQRPGQLPALSRITQATSNVFSWTLQGTLTEAPHWWSKTRDDWLSNFHMWEGNDLLAGAVSTLVAKIASANFYIEGPIELAKVYRNIFLHQSEHGAGWDPLISKWVQSYLCRDGGGLVERMRTSARDRTGPLAGIAHLDEAMCYYRGDPEWPVSYEQVSGKLVKMHRSQVMRITDMPSAREKDLGVGFCSVSRALSTAHILMDLVRYKRERLSDLPPAGILFINNMTERQWQDIVKKYDTRQRNQGNTTWRDILVACGLDPEYQVGAELLELSRLWDSYDEKVVTEIAIFTFALAFRVDPREYWPVSAGEMGTATEAKIQHLKAKAKGEGIIFSAIERQLNNPLSLPQELIFRFDYRDADEELQKAEVHRQKIENIRKMWESSPNRQALVAPNGQPVAGPDDNVEEEREEGEEPVGEGPPSTEEASPILNQGIISTEEARLLLAREGLIPADFVTDQLVGPEKERMYAIRNWGPYVRIYRDGSIMRL